MNVRNAKQKLQSNEVGRLFKQMMDNIEPENYDEWVEKLEVRPELREELSKVVAEELERAESERTEGLETDDAGNIKFGE